MVAGVTAVWGLVSDVHGNLPALDDALAILARAGATRLAFLGDYLGRGDSSGCVRRIRQVADVAVLGNRDLDWRDRISAEERAWVEALPRSAQADGLLFVHGDARLTPGLDTGQTTRGFQRTWRLLEERGARLLAFGHSHQARTWRMATADAPPEPLAGDEVPLAPDFRYLLNVGTTGLPFPGRGGPSVALVDLASGRLRHIALPRRGRA